MNDVDTDYADQVALEDTTEDDLQQALARGDVGWAAQVLKGAEAIGQPCLGTIASLLTGFPECQRGYARRFAFRLKLSRVRPRGRPRTGGSMERAAGEDSTGCELFDALASEDTPRAAEILRKAKSVGQPWLAMIANHLSDNHRPPFRLELVRPRGAPRKHDPSRLYSRSWQIVRFIDAEVKATGRKKDALRAAQEKFGVKGTIVTDAVTEGRRRAKKP